MHTHLFCNIWGNPDIHNEAEIGAYTEIGSTPEHLTKIGRCKISAKVFIPPGTTIEDDVFIGPGVLFANDKHPQAWEEWVCKGTTVKKGAVIGMGAIIGPGLVIAGIVGMGAVVTKNVPAGETWVGNPARKLDV